jgi:hypothetical protein
MKVIICAPIQSSDHSNGILALIHLGKTLEEKGVTVLFCVMGEGLQSEYIINIPKLLSLTREPNSYEYSLASRIEKVVKKFNIQLLLKYDDSDISESVAIYPETILGNPLECKKVVRYFGNKNGVLVEEVKVTGDELVLAHSRSVLANADQYLFFSHIDPVFRPAEILPSRDRKFSSYYVGKGYLYGTPHQFDDAIEITRHWPSKKKQLSILLQNSQFLFTYDSWTNTNVEAVLCGAIPVYLNNGPFTDEEIDGSELGVIPRVKFNEEISYDDEYIERFSRQRSLLIGRIDAISKKWDSGVSELIENIHKRFF